MHYSCKHLLQNLCGLLFTEPLYRHDAVEEFAAGTVFHHNVDVLVVDVGLVKFDDVRVVGFLKNCKFLLQKLYVFGDLAPEDGLDGVKLVGIRPQGGQPN